LTTLPLAISLGDPAGIGPEVVVRALALRPAIPALVFGDPGVLARAARVAGVPAPPEERVRAVTGLTADEIRPGQPSETSGRAQVAYLRAATEAVLQGSARGLVTAPISKEWAGRAGFQFPGHTEFLADAAGVNDFAMMLAGPKLRVTLATIHVGLGEMLRQLTAARIVSAALLTARALRDSFGISVPRVAIAGLNPHAGEGGRFGDEEARLVRPAVAEVERRLAAEDLPAAVSGPHVPDAVFRQAALGGFDAVVALYHDQGLIPVKLLHFDQAVNVTLGLPFVRTSPDHGTAYDIAGTGQAREDSFLAALDLAGELSRRRSVGSAALATGGSRKSH
jgi:4-hydroxythreonine-4-phosphate dehydrogenase